MARPYRSYTRILAASILFLVSGACADEPTFPDSSESLGAEPNFSAAHVAGEPIGVPAVTIDLPTQARPWDMSDSALVSAIAEENGHAVIGMKERGSADALAANGYRAAISAEAITGALAMLRGRGVEIIELYDAIGAAHVQIDPELAAELANHPLVDYVEPRQWMRLAGIRGKFSRDATTGTILAQATPWGISMVRAPEAWSVTRGSGVVVEIIDTGHQQGHEDLPYIPNSNCSGIYGGCDDGYPIPHGTHVTGIFLARDNSLGVVGVANGISGGDIYQYGACDSSTGFCSSTEIIAGINAGIWNADIISMSLGGPYDVTQANAVAQAWANDIVVVAAAGNGGGNTVRYPAGYSDVIGVSGVKQDGTFASTSPCILQSGASASSNYGSHVDLAAPFWALSTVPIDDYADQSDGWCGTSMATPHVSGAAALVRAHNPSWTNQQVVDQLLNTAEDKGAFGRDDYYGYGIVDAAEAVGYSPAASPDVTISGPTLIQPGATCSWEAIASGGTPPYSYAWTNDGLYAGSGKYYTGSKDSGNTGSSFPLQVTVTDAGGMWDSHQITVREDTRAMVCQI